MSHTVIQPPTSNFKRLWLMVGVLLIATAFRFLAIDSAPPGWRDDELIEYNMDRRIADGWRPLFITEAEGHEPVYHYLHAGTILLFGDNIVGYKWLPMAFGLLTIALMYALAKKMFNVRVAVLAAALIAVSFWPIMYSRFGVRHIGLLPWMLVAFYWLYPSPQPSPCRGEGVKPPRPFRERIRGEGRVLLAGICLAAGMMTYFAGRAVPIVLAGFLAYLLIFQRSILKRMWWRYALAVAIGVAIAAPMFIEIANTPGAEKRTEVVGGPLIELRKGNVRPAVETTLGTLGMFTFAADPESLYNVPGRPVFDWITGAFFYLGVLMCLLRLKRVESGFALAWLAIGIAPAFVSVPAGSFSHTIAALPVVYVFVALGVAGVIGIVDKYTSRQGTRPRSLSTYLLVSLSTLLFVLNGWLTIRDYFGTWANDWLVQFQYHAPTREIARWLDQTPQINDVAIGTHPSQLILDPMALQLDLRRALSVSWFNSDSALILPPGRVVLFSALQQMGNSVRELVETYGQTDYTGAAFTSYVLLTLPEDVPALGGNFDEQRLKLNIALRSTVTAKPGQAIEWRTFWQMVQPLSITRAKLFLHVLNDHNEVVVGDDREDLNFATVQAGAEFWQISSLTLPTNLPGGHYAIEIGWYQPETGMRLKLDDGSDRFLLPPLEVVAP